MMIRRITALILLAGFVFVILNILFFNINTEISVFIYVAFCVYYLLFLNKRGIEDNPDINKIENPEIKDNDEKDTDQK